MPLDCQITHIAVHTPSSCRAPPELPLGICADSSCTRPAGQVLPVHVVLVIVVGAVGGCKNCIKNILFNSHV